MVSRAVCSCHCCGKKKKKSCTHPRVETQMELFSLKPPSSSSSSPPPPVSRWTTQLRVCVSVCFWGRSPPIILQSSDYSDRVHHQNSRVVMCTVKLYTQARTNSRVGAVRKVQMKIDACINEQNVSFVITFFVYLRRHIYRAMMVRVIPAPDRHTLSRLATQWQASQWGYD